VPQYWLVKSEPGDYAFADLVRDKKTVWTGVRNFEARNNLRAMKKGDFAFYYHTGDEKQIVGLVKIVKPAYPDPSAEEGDWSVVDVAPVKALRKPVSLTAIKADKKLADFALVKRGRLSVVPVSEAQFQHIAKLGGVTL
jgi:predicted RNA-binding protein with PUA-like domain